MMRIEVYVIYLFFILVRNENICVKLVFWKGLKFLGGDKKKYLLLIFIQIIFYFMMGNEEFLFKVFLVVFGQKEVYRVDKENLEFI